MTIKPNSVTVKPMAMPNRDSIQVIKSHLTQNRLNYGLALVLISMLVGIYFKNKVSKLPLQSTPSNVKESATQGNNPSSETIQRDQPLGYTLKDFSLDQWPTYTHQDLNFSIKHHPNWDLLEDQYLEKNEIFHLSAAGDQQGRKINATELYDGISMSIRLFDSQGVSVQQWANDHSEVNWYATTIEREIVLVRLGDNDFFIAEHCSDMMCLVDLFIGKNDEIFQISLVILGPDTPKFYELAKASIASFTF